MNKSAEEYIKALMPFDTFCDICGYFYNANLEDGGDERPDVNNGYNCRHSACEEEKDGVGCCHTYTCPLCYEANGETCQQCGNKCAECGNEECQCEDDYVVASIPKRLFNEQKMYRIL